MIAAGNVKATYPQLKGIWIQAGGDPQAADMAASIAMAESGGNSAAYGVNQNGTIDRGYWQVNSTHGAQSSFDVMTNARAAVAISNNGKNWRPWCTAYSDGACGTKGGQYLGSGAPYQQYLQPGSPTDSTLPINATNAAANQPQPTAQDVSATSTVECWFAPILCAQDSLAKGVIQTIVGGVLNPLIQLVAGVLGIGAGGLLMTLGLFLIVRQTQTYQKVSAPVKSAAQVGAMLAAPEAAPFLARTGAERAALTARQSQRERLAARQQQGTGTTQTTVTRSQEGNKTVYTTTRNKAVGMTTKEQLRGEAGKYVKQPNGNGKAGPPV